MKRNALALLVCLGALALVLARVAQGAVNSDQMRQAYLRSERSSQFVWRRRRDMPEPKSDFALVRDTQKNQLYIVAGCKGENVDFACTDLSKSVIRYSPDTDEYAIIGDLQTPRYRHGAGLVGNEIVVFGGLTTGEDTLTTIEFFNIQTNTSRQVPAGSLEHMADIAYLQTGNRIFSIGGYVVLPNPGGIPEYVAQSGIYELKNGVFEKVADMTKARGDAFATVVLDTVFIVGGWTHEDEFVTPLGYLETFNLNTRAVALDNSDNLIPGRGDAAFCALRGRLFVFGGESVGNLPIDEVEVLSLDYRSVASRDWAYAGELADERFRSKCAAIDFNSIQLFGGQEIIGNRTTATARVDEFVEIPVYENLDKLLPTPLYLTGTWTSAPWIWTAAHLVESMSRTPVRISYRAVSSDAVATEFGAEIPRDHMYVADGPLPKSIYNSIKALGHTIVQIPLGLSAVKIVYNLKTEVPLDLDACTLARIFSGRAGTWKNVVNAAGIPDVPVQVHRHSNTSSTHLALASYLQAACPSEFILSAFNNLPEVSSRNTLLYVEGEISYTTRSQFLAGHDYKVARVKNAAGNFTEPQTADLTLSLPPNINDLTVDLSGLNFLNAQGIKAYPIVMPTFAYVRVDQTGTAQQGPLLKAFLTFLLSNRGQSIGSNFGHAKPNVYWTGVALEGVSKIHTAIDSVEYVIDSSTSPEPDFSISGTRLDRVDYDMFALQSQQAQLDALLAQVMTTRDSATQSSMDNKTAQNVAIAALVFGLLSLLLALYGLLKIRAIGNGPNIGLTGNDGAKSEAANVARYGGVHNHSRAGIGGDDHIQMV